MRLEETGGNLLRAGTEVATRESLDRELGMVERVNRGTGEYRRLGSPGFAVSDRLRPEQKRVVEFVLESRDLAVNIRGAAGTGKTTTLEELHRGLRESGREVLAVAPTMTAVDELRKVGFNNAVTVARLLEDPQVQAGMHDRVVIVDEAGMVSARQMCEVLRLAEARSARVVFSGDTRQIQSVEAGDALRVLEGESWLKGVSLTQVQRQTVREYREAVEQLRESPEIGFSKLEQMGAVHEVAREERARTVADAYARYRGQTNARGEASTVLAVCWTHEEVGRVTESIREERRRAGELGEGMTLDRHVDLKWTEARKRDVRNYRAGQVLEFHRPARGILKHEMLEVDRVEDGRVIVRNARGEERALTAKQAGCFSVQERKAMEVSSDDRLLLTANRRERGFRATNGELVTVRSVDRQGRIELTDGRTLPDNYRQFTHGYAVTADRSQAKTVDFVVISANAMRKERFYVAVTRGREGVSIVTSDKESLRRSVGCSSDRQSAIELARKVERPGLQQGDHRGIEAARYQAQRVLHENAQAIAPPAKVIQQALKPAQEQKIEKTIQQEIGNGIGYGL
jgi:ATP-dependent exoDNAse (exonuclease V) alpha subunit